MKLLRLLRPILLILLLSTLAQAQSGTTTTSRIKSGTSDPASCEPTGINIFYRSDTGSLKVCTATNTWTASGGGSLPVVDTTALVSGSSDATKLLRFEVDGFTTATTRVLTPPNADGTIAILGLAQTWTAAQTLQVTDSVDNTTTNILTTTHRVTTGTTANFGTGLLLKGSDGDGGSGTDDMAQLAAIWSDATNTSEDSSFIVQLRTAGAALATKFTFNSLGNGSYASQTLSASSAPITFSDAGFQSCTSLATNASGQLTCTVSTAMQKLNISPSTKGLDSLLKINPSTFEYKPDSPSFDNATHLGLIAENLEKANPLLVSRTKAGVLQPEPLALHALTIAAIKELEARVRKLEQGKKH